MSSRSRILVVGPSWIGDMVMTQSLLKLLKLQNEHVVIDVVAPIWSLPVLARMQEVNQAIALDIPHGSIGLLQRFKLARTIRANKYDQAIVIPRSYKSAILPWISGIPIRTGWLGEYRFLLLNDVRKLDKKKYPRMIDRLVALGLPPKAALPQFVYPALTVNETDVATTLTSLHLQKSPRPILVLCPGAEYGSAKRWSEKHYAMLAKYYAEQNWQIWLLGSANDRPVIDAIQTLSGNICHNFAGVTSLTQSIDLLSQASVVVSNDSGLMHVTASLNKPLVALFGSTSPITYAPLSNQAKVLSMDLACSPCAKRVCPLGHHACMEDLKPQRVIDAIKALTQSTITSDANDTRSNSSTTEFA